MSRKRAVELYLEKMPVKAKPIRHLSKLFKKDPSNVRHALNSLLELGLVAKEEVCFPGRSGKCQRIGWKITDKGAEVLSASQYIK